MKIQKEQLNAAIRDIPIPDNLIERPVTEKGYPVPFFSSFINGRWDLRVTAAGVRELCYQKGLCWLCGKPVGSLFSFVTGPMCVVTTTTAEPPCHYSCARYACIACPFLTQPRMKRNEKDMPEERQTHPGAIMRNPGVAGLLMTRSFRTFPAGDSWMISMGPPTKVEWYCEGKPATYEQVMASVDSGEPLLRAACDAEPNGREAAAAHADLDTQFRRFRKWLPRQHTVDTAAAS